jgi:hypothetical protein
VGLEDDIAVLQDSLGMDRELPFAYLDVFTIAMDLPKRMEGRDKDLHPPWPHYSENICTL